MPESKEGAKGWRPDESLEERLKDSKDEDLKGRRSEVLEIWVDIEELVYEESSNLVVAIDFLESR